MMSLLPRGCTALLDAVGRAIKEVGERLTRSPEDQRPGLVANSLEIGLSLLGVLLCSLRLGLRGGDLFGQCVTLVGEMGQFSLGGIVLGGQGVDLGLNVGSPSF